MCQATCLMAKALNLFSYRNKITIPILYLYSHVHHRFSHSRNNLSVHWWISGLKKYNTHKYKCTYKGNNSAVYCPNSQMNEAMCTFFLMKYVWSTFQTYFIFCANMFSFLTACNKEKRSTNIQGEEENSWVYSLLG